MSDETKEAMRRGKAVGWRFWGAGGPGDHLKVATITYLFDCEKERAFMRERSGPV